MKSKHHILNEITNWSGVSVAGSWKSVSATWQIPSVSQPDEVAGADGGWDSSTWIGLDGAGSDDILQAGVQQSVDANGQASYTAWYEWFCMICQQTLSETSLTTPVLTALNTRFYLAWVDAHHQLNLLLSSDTGQSFANKLTTTETTSQAPSLASDGNHLYLAWINKTSNQITVATVNLDANTGAPLALVKKISLN